MSCAEPSSLSMTCVHILINACMLSLPNVQRSWIYVSSLHIMRLSLPETETSRDGSSPFVVGHACQDAHYCSNSANLALTVMIFGTEPGDRVEVDEPIAQVETDKVILLIIYNILS